MSEHPLQFLPMYRKIAADLQREIESGQLESGQQLKTELELREQYSASRNTVRDAIRWLTNLGLVETRPGQGTFVTRTITPYTTVISDEHSQDGIELEVFVSNMEREGRHIHVTEPRVEIQRASDELADQLGIDEGQPVISRHQQVSIDGIPWCQQATFYPMDFVNRGALQLIETKNLDSGVLAYLKNAIGVRQMSWSDLITARAPQGGESDFFSLPDSGRVPVLEIRRTGYDQSGRPMRLSITVFPADRNKFMYKEGHKPT